MQYNTNSKVFKMPSEFDEHSSEIEMPTTTHRWLSRNLSKQRSYELVFKGIIQAVSFGRPDHGYRASASYGVSVYPQHSPRLPSPTMEGWPGSVLSLSLIPGRGTGHRPDPLQEAP